jgi:hypothetical protein
MMFQFLYPTVIVQHLSLLLLSSAFLFLGLNVAVAWGASQTPQKTTINTVSSAKKVSPKGVKKTAVASRKPQSTVPEFSLPDGEYLEASPETVKFPPNTLSK